LLEIPIGEFDKPIWNSKKGLHSWTETWEFLRQKKKKRPEVTWFKVVWFPLAIPRHAFMLSLVFRGALVTKEKSVVGDLVETLYAVYAIALRKMLSICSSNLVSAVEYGGMYDKT
jgi:hypothetical protein